MPKKPIDIPFFFIAIAIYAASGVVAFGHSASTVKVTEGLKFSSVQEQRAIHGLMAAMFNPFYWAWVCFEKPTTCLPNTAIDGQPPLPVRTDGGLLRDDSK
jgi:hypothetical protein